MGKQQRQALLPPLQEAPLVPVGKGAGPEEVSLSVPPAALSGYAACLNGLLDVQVAAGSLWKNSPVVFLLLR